MWGRVMDRRWIGMVLCGIAAVVVSCTHNPFFDDAAQTMDGSTIRGKILMNDGASSEGTYVWLQGMNISTTADENGEFLLTLPNPNIQPGGGLSGEFELYVYMGNYIIRSCQVLLLSGKVKYGQADVDASGHIRFPIMLQKMLTIEMNCSPSSYTVGDRLNFEMEIELTALVDPLVVQMLLVPFEEQRLGRVFFRDVHAAVLRVYEYRGGGALRKNRIRGADQSYFVQASTTEFPLPPGTYEVVPYLDVLQTGIPDSLLASLGINPDKIDKQYLNIPYVRPKLLMTVHD